MFFKGLSTLKSSEPREIFTYKYFSDCFVLYGFLYEKFLVACTPRKNGLPLNVFGYENLKKTEYKKTNMEMQVFCKNFAS